MKSFPHPAVRELAARFLAGFDAASDEEARTAPGTGVLSIFDPSGRARVPAGRRVIVSCETVEQVRAAPAHADIAVRVSASITGRDPAIGAILDGSGYRRSRFGISDTDDLRAMFAAANGRRTGVHVHHGSVTAANAERFVATARQALALADGAAQFINLGGAWHGIDDPTAALAEIRAALPDIEIFIEPGRALTRDAGFATGRVLVRREVAERLVRVVELSRVCHLRWSQPELVAPPPRADVRRKVVVVGPTCYEEDVIGEWIVDAHDVDERVVLRNVSGYAIAWNVGFAGVPPADVVVVA
jgi:diaminopimelate decarboxylase